MYHHTLDHQSARYAAYILKICGGNKGRACAVLGISYPTLQRYLALAQQLREDAAKAAA